MLGMKITVSSHQCDWRFVRWVRTHRNNRIARKWHKRYGAVRRCEQKSVIQAGGMLVCCPHMQQAMNKVIAAQSQAGNYTAAHLGLQSFRSPF